jgi:hypothetical protein
MAAYNPASEVGTLHAPYDPFPPQIHLNAPLRITAPDAVGTGPLNPATSFNTIASASACAESPKCELDNSVAQPAKKARKQRGENAQAAQGAGEAPTKKPRKGAQRQGQG